MKKYIYLFPLIGMLGLSACSDQDKQAAVENLSKKSELEKAEQVQKTVDDKAAEERKSVEEMENAEGGNN
jgi:hypothetical protein